MLASASPCELLGPDGDGIVAVTWVMTGHAPRKTRLLIDDRAASIVSIYCAMPSFVDMDILRAGLSPADYAITHIFAQQVNICSIAPSYGRAPGLV
jgi:hypothetical protein